MAKVIKKDVKNYQEMCIPYESQDEANKATGAFYEELGELRKKYKIRDCLVVIYGSFKNGDDEGEFMNSIGFGNSLNQLPMAAFAYGKEKHEHSEIISKLLAGK